MGRIVAEGLLLLAIIAVILVLARRWDHRPRTATSATELEPPRAALWSASHRGSGDNQTEISVILRTGTDGKVWDRRVHSTIPNGDLEYDKKLYNALEDARARAVLLNTLRDE